MAEAEQTEVQMESGPKRDRSITDFIFCIVMIVFWVATIVLAIIAFSLGDPSKLIQTYDFQGTPCGKASANTANFKYTYFYRPFSNFSSVVCLTKCPTWAENQTPVLTVDCFAPNVTYNADINGCVGTSAFDFKNFLDISNFLNLNKFVVYNTTTEFDRFCMPYLPINSDNSTLASLQQMKLVTQTQFYFQQYMSDIKASWKYFLVTVAISAVISVFSLIFIRWCAGVLVWVIILLYLVAVFMIAALCGYQYNRIVENMPETLRISTNPDYKNAQNYYIAQIVLYCVGGISVIVVLMLVQTISVTISIIKTTSMFIFSNLLIIFVPLLSIIAMSLYIALWISVLVFLWSVGTEKQRSNSPFSEVEWSKTTQYFLIFHAFALLWNVAFLNYYGSFIISCVCGIWYFNGGKDQNGFFSWPILTSSWWGIRYHLGSLSFGSFILAICWTAQIILEYLRQYAAKLSSGGINSVVINLFLRCLSCYVNCFTRFIEFISELGFAQVAITSNNFCTSCAEAFALLVANPLKFGAVGWIGSSFVFLGKVFVGSVSGVIGYFLISADKALNEVLYERVVPILFMAVIGYIVGSVFFSVFGSASNAMLLCFFYDKQECEKYGRPNNAPTPMVEFYEQTKQV